MNIKNLILSTALLCGTAGISAPAYAGPDPFIGEIMLVGYNFCPRGFASAEGQLLPIAQNTALFSLYGTQYGGDGRTTFALPDLRGRTVVGQGTGPGLSTRREGQRNGSETNTMTVAQMPSHGHRTGIRTKNSNATSGDPSRNVFADTSTNNYTTGPADGNFMDETSIQLNATGGNQSVNNMQPYQVLRYCVALQGVFPSRN